MHKNTRLRIVVVALIAVSVPSAPRALTAQEAGPILHSATAPPSDARFEILQVEIGSKWTLKLDRVTGNVENLELDSSGKPVWKRMRVLPHPKAVNETKPHFQIFVSKTPNEAVLLLDADSGATWQLLSKTNAVVWQPIE